VVLVEEDAAPLKVEAVRTDESVVLLADRVLGPGVLRGQKFDDRIGIIQKVGAGSVVKSDDPLFHPRYGTSVEAINEKLGVGKHDWVALAERLEDFSSDPRFFFVSDQ
jgi:hypothetical protein